MNHNTLISIDEVSKEFSVSSKKLKALTHVSFDIKKGETVGLVGESGCGKSTLGRLLMGIYTPTSGKILYDGIPVVTRNTSQRKQYAKHVQMIFQDPYASLNPRMTVGDIIKEGMVIHHLYEESARQMKVLELLDMVGLNEEYENRFPHEFSGGQRQRIGIARALAVEPEFLICDEPISALDVSIQSQVINLLIDLQKQLGLTYLFIAHDLDIVRYISDRIAVMYLGHVVEIGKSNDVYSHALHPYTKALLSSVPIADPILEKQKQRIILEGEVPSPIHLPKGCPFIGRCDKKSELCQRIKPELIEYEEDHFVACHHIEQ